ncbi:MAG TPA: sigma-70 family RNA polymerase sigma factor [Candidatus Sulfotelmatobacter sp.]|nr:sigma-70 family RNA polymerase sigma factor [Candidatus Sulfotelmatobacter sp.]
MSDSPDAELLEQFARNHSEAAFAELVERYIGLVYSVAFRKTGNPQQAEDITQAVFIILARKAGSLGPKTVLPAWLHRTARLTAANLQRAEVRRLRREQEAFMQSTINESALDALWHEMSPLLDDAVDSLGKADRDAIVLRFFENKNFTEVGGTIGTTEHAARMRVNRALGKLHKYFSRRGVNSTTFVIVGAISANSVQAVPPALAKSATAIALAKGGMVSASTLTLVKGALKVMAWSKAKTFAITSAALLFTAGSTSFIAIHTCHAIREAYYPNIAGTWEGVAQLSGDQDGTGIKAGQAAQTRVVLKLFKTNGVYRATTDWIDLGQKDVPMGDVTYGYPNLVIQRTVRDYLSLKVNPHATKMIWDNYINFIQPDRVVLTRTTTPDTVPEPLTDSDFAPRPGSALQGYWEGNIGTGPGALPVDVKIAQGANGTFRAEFDNPMEGVQGLPAIVSYNPPLVRIKPADGAGIFSGQLNDSGAEISGSWTQGGQTMPEIIRRADYQAEHAHDADKDYSFTSENDLQGHWKGSWISPLGNHKDPIRQKLDIAKLPDGSYSVTIANLDGLGVNAPIPASVFEYSPPTVHAEWKWEGWAYDGKLENGKLIGTWEQNGGGWPLVFERQN